MNMAGNIGRICCNTRCLVHILRKDFLKMYKFSSNWSDGAITSRDEQWVETVQEHANSQVRRRFDNDVQV